VAFGLHTPALFQSEHINRDPKEKRYRERLSSLNAAHASVAPYAHQIIFYLYDDGDVEKIADICNLAGLPRPMKMNIEIQSRALFTPAKLDRLSHLLRRTDWKVAFQLEILLRNGLLNIDDIIRIHSEKLQDLYRTFDGCPDPNHSVSQVLRGLVEKLRTRQRDQTVADCIKACLDNPDKTKFDPFSARMPNPGDFLCYHVTFTPTRMILEGPYITQSNRVIRKFPGFEQNFIRVDFRDENRTQFRWEQDVNGMSLLQERVGDTLKKGFTLAGRHLEFLAYSSSALREHAVWFVLPFSYKKKEVTAQSIRDSLGNFSRDQNKPAKLAARMAQAFTATNPGVTIRRDQWEEISDLGNEPYLHTDGVGTISKALGEKLWQKFCMETPNRAERLEPSAVSVVLLLQTMVSYVFVKYQIRFLGYKGVVAIDQRLEGIKMCLRPSMNKFTVDEVEEAEIEIVQPFERPITAYLNRQGSSY
jgi:RNA-dependent RNA polymerase